MLVAAGGVTAFEVVEVANAEDVKAGEDCADELGLGIVSGGGSLAASTQYDLPTIRLPQSAAMEGFCPPH
jgi:hypothetical protein